VVRLAITVRGVVQGVGFRPFVYNAALSHGLTGWVQNQADTVQLEVQGEAAAVATFLDVLRNSPPPQARIDDIQVRELPATGDSPSSSRDLCNAPAGDLEELGQSPGFEIRSSTAAAAPRPTIPADLAACESCLAEIFDPHERRYRYPFTNCTNCGPRWSIIAALPYDRPRTSMAGFQMCADCRAEYTSPADRRFHAQPIACPRCGPKLKAINPEGRSLAEGAAAMERAVEAILAGQIVALRGLGGFQLLVDATNRAAVARLRQRKNRPDRPFALMVPSLDSARRYCDISAAESRALASSQAPILLLRRGSCPLPTAPCTLPVADAVAPGNPYLGIMLPYTPLHHLLMAAVARPIVCTSGNLSEEPMAVDTDDALHRLGPIADLLLTHDRPIVRPVDDSVARFGADGFQMLRRARGYAPLPIVIGKASPTILAVGGHLKNTVALALGRRSGGTPVVLSSHIGDLESIAGVTVFRRAIDDLLAFFQTTPEVVACDLHPDYASTRHAEALAARWKVPLLRVQHHHAHIASCMAEHGLDGPLLGLAWDGTGYGTDGTIWGGEMLRCEGGQFRRLAHLRTFALPGGDRAVREPRRAALGLLFEILGPQAAAEVAYLFSEAELPRLVTLLTRRVRSPRTSSLGRLFDAVAALCGGPAAISFEGQAAMALEFAADPTVEEAYPLPLVAGPETAVADWEPLVRAVLTDRAAGEPVGRIAARFHNALAELAVAAARLSGCSQVALSGGCFQNALLTQRVRSRLLAAGFSVYMHRQVPPGDGGIALGQVFIAASTQVPLSLRERAG
jgi:hydrogenase maturation protein HypF